MHHGSLTKAVAKGLTELKRRILEANIPSSKLDESLNIATWNIREFGKKPRLEGSLHYIAEILGQFDLISVVELRENVSELAQVIAYLGPYWDVVYSDYVQDAGGNHERVAFIFDRRAVTFTGYAGNIASPRKKKGAEYVSEISWWRPPYAASFRAGNFDFVLLAAHIRWGRSEKERTRELTLLSDWVGKRQKSGPFDDKDVIVIGDFNIPSMDSPLYDAVVESGLQMPKPLLGLHGSNLAKDKRYDQILHLPKFTKSFTDHGGVLDFYQGDHKALFPGKRLSKQEFTFELSDHLPLWAQVNTDTDLEELDQVLNGRGR